MGTELDELQKLSKEINYPKALWGREMKITPLTQRVWQWNVETEFDELQKLPKQQEN